MKTDTEGLETFVSLWKHRVYRKAILHAKVCERSRVRYGYRNPEYDALIALRELTERIDFGCNFGLIKTHLCHKYEKPNNPKDKAMCCCINCADSFGYLKIIPINQLKYYVRNFNEKTGFWREGKGCILPRNRRSNTCVTFACYELFDRNSKNYKERLNLRGLHVIEKEMNRAQDLLIEKYKMGWDDVYKRINKMGGKRA